MHDKIPEGTSKTPYALFVCVCSKQKHATVSQEKRLKYFLFKQQKSSIYNINKQHHTTKEYWSTLTLSEILKGNAHVMFKENNTWYYISTFTGIFVDSFL